MDWNEELWHLAHHHARRFLGRFEDAFTRAEQDDLVQDSTLAACQWVGSVREPACFAAVVRTIARRKRCRALHEHHRRLAVHRVTDTGYPDSEPSAFSVAGRTVPHEWLVPRLMRALRRLRAIDRRILMAFMEGFCSAEIADRYHLTEQNVKVRVHRARRRVRLEIEDAVRAAEHLGGT